MQASLAGLSPSTTYYYRLSATNHCNTEKPAEECTVHGEGASFTTQRAIAVESESALGVSSDAASLEGVLNPLGVQAQWWVEYGTVEGVFDHSTVRESLAAGSVGVSVGVHVQGLEPGTVYHYRFAASDEREGHPYTSYGESLSFKTQPALVSSSLLDGRAWEMVSPLDKQGASFAAPGGGDAPLEQAAVDGSAVTYGATASIEGAPPGEPSGSGLWVQVLSRHAGDGWSSRDMASPHEEEWGFETGYSNEFAWFSSDLSLAIVSPEGNTLLGGASERTPYLRRQALCEDSARAAECYLPLVNTGNVTSGEKWGGSTENKVEGEVKAAASPSDSSHLVLVSKVPLLAGTSGPGVYEWSAGRLVLVSVLPGEAPMPAGCVPQTNAGQHSVSTNADRIFWETSCQGPGGAGAEHHLYMREAAGARTVQLDVGVVGNEANFQDASSDASRVFFWDGAYTAPPDLYVYEARREDRAIG